jgi:Skp family chaperone for outer membrane proteins
LPAFKRLCVFKVIPETTQMKKYIHLVLIAIFSTVLFSTQASAQRRGVAGGRTDSLSVEQRKAYRQQLQAKYDSLSPEQKKGLRKNMKARMDSLPPDQRKEMRQKMKAKYKSMTPEERQKLRDDVLKAADSTGQQPVRRRRGGIEP